MIAIASQITSFTIVYTSVYPGADQSKDQSSALLAFVRGIHRWPVNSPHKGPVTRKMLPFDDVIMIMTFLTGDGEVHSPLISCYWQLILLPMIHSVVCEICCALARFGCFLWIIIARDRSFPIMFSKHKISETHKQTVRSKVICCYMIIIGIENGHW